jgi:hypothetical protein
MKKAAIIALRHAKGAFLILHQHEMEVLRSLPSWELSLFTALLQHANHATGRGRTTYAALVASLTPIQPRRGPQHYVPTVAAIRRASCSWRNAAWWHATRPPVRPVTL